MQNAVLLALSLAFGALPARADAPGAPPTSAPCAAAVAQASAGRCAGEPLCEARERVAIACELGQAIESRYVFWSVKPALLATAGRPAFDPARHLAGCVAAEAAIEREEDPLRFFDRLRRCAAAFEDGHLIPSVPGGAPTVALGVGLRLASDGAVHVASRAPALLRWLEAEGGAPDAGAALAPGTTVVAVDGVPVDDALAELARHLPASSAAARRERAVDALTRRDFAHPRGRTATLTLAGAGGARRDVTLPWWVSPGAERIAAAGPWLRATGLATTGLLDWSAPPRPLAVDRAAGASRGDPAVSPADAALLTEYRGDAGQLAARLGEATAAGGARYCYAQLLTLHTDHLRAAGERGWLPDVVARHARGCAARGLDLVLDLRQNEGGWISHATDLARALAPAGAPPGAGALLLRANDHNERVLRARAPSLGALRAAWTGGRSEAEEMLDAVRAARVAGEEFTPAFVDPPPARAGAGLGRHVVALVAPTCMSACERLAAMLQGAGAVLVGGPTEGAGASHQEAGGIGARWVDAGGRFALAIPSAAMGVARPGAAGRTIDVARFLSDLRLENRPVEPDVRYDTGVDDLTRGNAGWRAAAEAALDGGGPAARGAAAAPRA